MTGKNLDDATPEEWDLAYLHWKSKQPTPIHEVAPVNWDFVAHQFKDEYKDPLKNPLIKDLTVERVVNKFIERSEIGLHKYGTTLYENPLDFKAWLVHLQEELMDAVLYIERAKQELRGK